MENFTIYNPVKVHFGSGVISGLGGVLKDYGRRILFVYGGGSIHRNGVYGKVMEQLSGLGCSVWEYRGIKPNPVVEDVDRAAALGRQEGVDLVLAVGGGSVIDSAKVIALAIPYGGPAWDLMSRKVKPAEALPVITVLTLAATGTEMNPLAVVQNNELGIKGSIMSPHIFPAHSFLDPSFTRSVPADYTGYGVADLIAHAMEAWFGRGESPLADRTVLGILHEAMEVGPLLLKDLENYDLRARIMYASTMALNGTCMHGRAHGDWGVHATGHILSLLYDVPHGASLTIVYPAWMKLMKEKIPDRIRELMFGLFRSENVDDGIYRFEQFFRRLGCPVTLTEAGISAEKHPEILASMIHNKVSGMHYQLTEPEYQSLLQLMK